MQQEAFKIQRDLYMKIKDMQMLDLSPMKIRQILVKEGLGEDLKAFNTEMGEAKGKLKEKAVALKERQQLIKAAGLVSEKLDMVTEALGKIPVFEVLNELKSSTAKKYERVTEMLKEVAEDTKTFVNENK